MGEGLLKRWREASPLIPTSKGSNRRGFILARDAMVGCSTCGRELAYIAQYDRHYCYSCRAYAPKDMKPCPTCGRALVYVPQYQRHYCYGCQEYKQPVQLSTPAQAQAARAGNPCPTCGRELTYIQQYNRHYCYSCKAYAPLRRDTIAAIPAARPAAALTATQGAASEATLAFPRAEATPALGRSAEALAAAILPRGELPFTREELDAASKDQLMRWCQSYSLEASGMKYELRLRLLEYIKAKNLPLKGGPPNREGVPAEAPVAQAVGAGSGEIVIEAITDEEEGEEERPAGPPAAASLQATAAPVASATPVQVEEKPTVETTAVAQPAQASPKPTVASPAPVASQPTTAAVTTPVTAPVTTPMATEAPRFFPAATYPQQGPACPTCSGPLNYISQYGRYYCYRCQAYAPLAKTTAQPAFQAPAAYALQRPAYVAQATAPEAVQRAPQATTSTAVVSEVTHGNVMVGVYLIIAGLVLYTLYEALFRAPQEFNFDGPLIPQEIGFALRYLAFFFVVVGTLAAVLLLRPAPRAKG